MANPRMSLLQLLDKAEAGADPEFLRDGLRLLVQELMDAEVTQLVGAGPYERSDTRLTQRNGYRERDWDTRVGTMELQIPKLRQGTYFPGLLEPRRRHERALLSVVQQAYVHGVSTRAVDHLAEALGLKGISKDQVSPQLVALLQEAEADVLAEQNDEWAVGRRYFSTESMNKLKEPSQEEVVQALLELESA